MSTKKLSKKQEDNYRLSGQRLTELNKSRSLPEGEASFRAYERKSQVEAGERNKGWFLSQDEFRAITGQNCTYCGQEPSQVFYANDCNGSYLHNGVDRKDNNLDYTSENSVPCCWKCNRAKSNMEVSEFLHWVYQVGRHQNMIP